MVESSEQTTDYVFFLISEFKHFKNVEIEGNITVDSASIKIVILSPADEERKDKQIDVKDMLRYHNSSIYFATSLLSDVVTKNTEQTIISEKVYFNGMTIKNLTTNDGIELDGNFNELDLSDFEQDVLYINKNANITGGVEFTENLIFERELDVNGKINGLGLSEVVFVNTNDTIDGRKVFNLAEFSSNMAKDLTVDGFVNGKYLLKVFKTEGDQTITSNLSFVNKVKFGGNVNTVSINGQDFTEFVNDAVMVNKNETIDSHKNFQRITVHKNFNIKELATINNVDVSELANNGVFLSAKDNVSEHLVFTSNVTFKGYLTVLGQINEEALDDIVFVNEAANISGSKIFTAGIHMENDIEIDGKVNGIDISGMYFHFKSPLNICTIFRCKGNNFLRQIQFFKNNWRRISNILRLFIINLKSTFFL